MLLFDTKIPYIMYIYLSLLGFLDIEVPGYPKDAIAMVDKHQNITCSAKGSPTPYVAWIHNGKLLVNKTFSANFDVKDEGNYTCIAINRERERQWTIQLLCK